MRQLFHWMRLTVAVCALFVAAPAIAADAEGFETIFDGKTLDGWDGNPEFWSVKDGYLTGQTTAEKPTKGNTFIIWRKGDTADFELKLEYKIIGGNSGIQYRSFEVPNEKWVVGGYQADFEAGPTFSGICYGERFRGILANRGQKTVIGDNHQPKVVGAVGVSEEIQKKIKNEDWNEYHVTAKGFDFVHKINGVTTCELTDEDKSDRREKGILALQLHAGPPMLVQFRNIRIKTLGGEKGAAAPAAAPAAKKKIVFVAGKPSHGYGAHEHNAGCLLLAKELKAAMASYETVVYQNGWPNDPNAFDGADTIIMYCDGGGGHMVNAHLDQVDALAKKGVGVVCVHYGVEVEKGKSGDRFLDWIGGYFEMNWSVNPHWTAKYEKFPDHPISRGVKPFEINDEWYYHMRFRPDMKGVTPILSALPPKNTLERPDGPHSGNKFVREAIAKNEAQHMAWAAERDGGGRGFGFTGGHDHWNWGDPNFRKVVLNAIVWTAHGEVPANGVESPTVALEDLEANQDYPQPAGFDREGVRKSRNLPAGKPSAQKKTTKPLFESKIVSADTPDHSVDINVEIKGSKEIYLAVTDGGNGFGCDWADWAEPRFVGPAGEVKLTDLKWKRAESGFGSPQVNKNCGGQALVAGGKPISYGIGTHAVSVIAYDVPAGAERFVARGCLDNDGIKQGCGSTVTFAVYNQAPTLSASTTTTSTGSHDPVDAVAALDVGEGLEATLVSSEPEISNLTALDIDHLGRIWVCEVKNYRKWNGSRKEGDRILVLEDTDRDGKADKSTTFYQGRDIDSAHGLCVLGNKVIVSAGDKVQVLTDENGDLKCDKQEVLFSGISGVQHDHGIHSFVFGPDGKLYFNFGNEGRQLKDKDGKPVVDMAGNEVNNSRKPYQEGMVFRCNLDGSELETLGWNFRNNWEVTVDSFGTMWQSDNDDDGNKGVRINYVMEYGNYGYKDEMTGAGWQAPRENLEKEIPLRHWHLNDPGVVPNLLQTGAGSPTGICVYEGTLLPKRFWGQPIHCDAGPSVVRAYLTTKDGAGYKAEISNVLVGTRDNWFRPSDVCVAPDGSLFIADWYDPGVGGHNQQDVDRGRLFRVAPPGSKYSVPTFDFTTAKGCVEALKSPCMSVRYLAYMGIKKLGDAAEHELEEVIEKSDNAMLKARALWALASNPKEADEAIELALKDKNPDIRVLGVRLAREHKVDVAKLANVAKDAAPEVRREFSISLRHSKSPAKAALWAELAMQHDGKDRWYLESLGIAAGADWDACLDAYLAKAGDSWNTPAGQDIIWRSRAKKTPSYLAKILKDDKTTEEQQARFNRAFDFLAGPEKEAALKSLLE